MGGGEGRVGRGVGREEEKPPLDTIGHWLKDRNGPIQLQGRGDIMRTCGTSSAIQCPIGALQWRQCIGHDFTCPQIHLQKSRPLESDCRRLGVWVANVHSWGYKIKLNSGAN